MNLSYVTIVWSMQAAAALLMGVVYFLVWARDRSAWASLAFSIVALSIAGGAFAELMAMQSLTLQALVPALRWASIAGCFLICGVVFFFRSYLGTGRMWLLWTIVGLRFVLLTDSFLSGDASLNFKEVTSIKRIPFMGETVSVIGQSLRSPRQSFATMSLLLLLIFLVDASVALWRKGGAENRRKAVVVGGSWLVGVALASLEASLVAWRVVRMPFAGAAPFLIPLSTMAWELSRDTLRAARLSRDLNESRLRLELAADAAGLGLWERDVGGNQFWATERARTLLGLASDGAIDTEQWMKTVHPDDADQVRRGWAQVPNSREEYAAEYRICLSEGEVRWVAVRARSEDGGSGKPTLMRGVIRDVTEQRQAQTKLDELQFELVHAGRVSMLGQLVSAITHELSRPLGAILRNADVAEMSLQESSPDLDELRVITTDIRRGVSHAGEVIERLRGLLKHRRMDLQPIDVENLLLDVNVLVRPDAVARNVELQLRLEPRLPLVAGDRVHLSQVLINLIINAMDSITDSAAIRRVLVEALSTPDGLIQVSVIDSGSGVSAEAIARVFEPFFTTKSTGMGMGLSISRTIIEAHGGRIWVENNPAGGATFAFTLPVAKAVRQQAA
jgi:PAS domain S-box-containing protein